MDAPLFRGTGGAYGPAIRPAREFPPDPTARPAGRVHLERIHLKLGVTDRLSAVSQARERHLL